MSFHCPAFSLYLAGEPGKKKGTHQKNCLKFCGNMGTKCSEAFKILEKVVGDDTSSQNIIEKEKERFQKTSNMMRGLNVLVSP